MKKFILVSFGILLSSFVCISPSLQAYNLTNIDNAIIQKRDSFFEGKFLENGIKYKESVISSFSNVANKTKNERVAKVFNKLVSLWEYESAPILVHDQKIIDDEESQEEKQVVRENNSIPSFEVTLPKYHRNILWWESTWVWSFMFTLWYQSITIEELEIETQGWTYEDTIQSFVLYGENGQEVASVPVLWINPLIVDLNYTVKNNDHLFIKAVMKTLWRSDRKLSQGNSLQDWAIRLNITKARGRHTLPPEYISHDTTWSPEFDVVSVDVSSIQLVKSYPWYSSINTLLWWTEQLVWYLVVSAKQSSNNQESNNNHADLMIRKIDIQWSNLSNFKIERAWWVSGKISISTSNLNLDFTDASSPLANDLILDTKNGENAIFKVYADVALLADGATISLDLTTDFAFSTNKTSWTTFVGTIFTPHLPNRSDWYSISIK